MNLREQNSRIIQSWPAEENRLKSMNRASETWDNDKISKIYITSEPRKANRNKEVKSSPEFRQRYKPTDSRWANPDGINPKKFTPRQVK